jgi:ribonucleotide monophosphatase NagD (HAD superfamily)
MICVNPDRAVMVAGKRILCAGALADVYRELGGAVCEVGKPDPAVYGPVRELLGIADARRIVAIGDTPHTDLAGAAAAGLDALWALTGLTEDAHGRAPRRSCWRGWRRRSTWHRGPHYGACAGS